MNFTVNLDREKSKKFIPFVEKFVHDIKALECNKDVSYENLFKKIRVSYRSKYLITLHYNDNDHTKTNVDIYYKRNKYGNRECAFYAGTRVARYSKSKYVKYETNEYREMGITLDSYLPYLLFDNVPLNPYKIYPRCDINNIFTDCTIKFV
jgi:hypothetical protein